LGWSFDHFVFILYDIYGPKLIQRVGMCREENEKLNVSVENKNEREENVKLKLKLKKNKRLQAVRKLFCVYLISSWIIS
jgi:hypothetical protein